MHYYIGTMSGTSIDGIDVVIVKFENNTRPSVVFATCSPYPRELKDNISKAITSPQSLSIESIGTLNTALGHAYANAINTALNEAQVGAEEIFAIGNHGQTLYHQPQSELPFSMQIGDASIIAEITGITTVCDFRSRDLAAGGQG
ncbi:MAG: anhydro-N-acetylmuramic acid kinase, partial [Nitratireductor sp.]